MTRQAIEGEYPMDEPVEAAQPNSNGSNVPVTEQLERQEAAAAAAEEEAAELRRRIEDCTTEIEQLQLR